MTKNYTLRGVVQAGHGKGKKLGAPTANLDIVLAVQQEMVPGLYVCTVTLEGENYRGLLYYGFNSLTLRDSLEAYLLGFDGDLYGKELAITTTSYVREPRAFTNEGDLKRQIAEDIAQALK